jgi:hypothetical protein
VAAHDVWRVTGVYLIVALDVALLVYVVVASLW